MSWRLFLFNELLVALLVIERYLDWTLLNDCCSYRFWVNKLLIQKRGELSQRSLCRILIALSEIQFSGCERWCTMYRYSSSAEKHHNSTWNKGTVWALLLLLSLHLCHWTIGPRFGQVAGEGGGVGNFLSNFSNGAKGFPGELSKILTQWVPYYFAIGWGVGPPAPLGSAGTSQYREPISGILILKKKRSAKQKHSAGELVKFNGNSGGLTPPSPPWIKIFLISWPFP